MKRHTLDEVIFSVSACIVMMVGCGIDVCRNAQKEAWGHFWLSLFSTVLFAAVAGWISIDAFNRMQRRRREKGGPSES